MPQANEMLIQVLAVAGAFFLGLVLLAWLLARFRGGPEPFPYEKKPVMSEAEQHFLRTLVHCLPTGTILLSKVRLADFLEVTERGSDYLRHFGRISQKHADFLVIASETSEPLLVVELDDASHKNSQRTMQSDAVKNQIFHAAELPLLRVPAQRRYDREDLKRLVREGLGRV